MEAILEMLKNINWPDLGATLITVVAPITGVVIWLRKNIINIKVLKQDSDDINKELKLNKAMLKAQNGLTTEFSRLKREYNDTKSYINKEMNNIKSEMKIIIKEAVKEALMEETEDGRV